MSTALKELPRIAEVPGGLLGRLLTVNSAIEKGTRNVRSWQKHIVWLMTVVYFFV